MESETANEQENYRQLRRLRKLAGMTLLDVFNATGFRVADMSDMERGKAKPDIHTMRKLAEVYHCDLMEMWTSATSDEIRIARLESQLIERDKLIDNLRSQLLRCKAW